MHCSCLIPRSIAASAFLVLSTYAFGLARWLVGEKLPDDGLPVDNVKLPEAVTNTFVRVQVLRNGRPFVSSGIVIDYRRDEDANTGWLCVLCCDHGTELPKGYKLRGYPWAIAFKPGKEFFGDDGLRVDNNRVYRPPTKDGGMPDISILGVPVTDWKNQVPKDLARIQIADYNPKADLILEGFGSAAKVFKDEKQGWAYMGIPDSYGTLRTGYGAYVDTEEGHKGEENIAGGTYKYTAIVTKSLLSGTAKEPTGFSAYELNGDSGGAMLQLRRGTRYNLVGIHSESLSTKDQIVYQDLKQYDVMVNAYFKWIEDAIVLALAGKAPVPMTASLSVPALGLFRGADASALPAFLLADGEGQWLKEERGPARSGL